MMTPTDTDPADRRSMQSGRPRQRCWRYDWVLDVDVRSYFDSIDWELLLKAVRKHTGCPWVLLYIERWLKAPVQMEDGSVVQRTSGTPQGGVVSPTLSNLFCTMSSTRGWRETIPAFRSRDTRTMLSVIAGAPKRLRRCGAASRLDLRPASSLCTRRRRSSSTARTRTGEAIFRTRRSTFSAMRSGRGRRYGTAISTRSRSCLQPVRRR